MTQAASRSSKRRFLAPEVVQTSGMDCGPAALKCLLEGHGVSANYARLREACQTDIDGTSIDTIEHVARLLGFDADQVMLPANHVLLSEAKVLPAVVLVRLANGCAHFVVVWSRHGDWVQVMDPATGRRFQRCDEFLSTLYLHHEAVPAQAFRDWAISERFLSPLRQRLRRIGMRDGGAANIASALSDPSWRCIAALDAAARMVEAMIAARGLSRGAQGEAALRALLEQEKLQRAAAERQVIPSLFWFVQPMAADEAGPELLLTHGAVLVSVGRRHHAAMQPVAEGDTAQPNLVPSLRAALDEPEPRPGRRLLRAAFADGLFAPALFVFGMVLAAAGVALEALLFRCLFDLGWSLSLVEQRVAAIGLMIVFALLLLALELPLGAWLLRFGRRLEARLRIEFLERLPRVDERYFASRPTSDIAERSHSVHRIRLLPGIAGRFLRTLCELVATTAGIIWLDPQSTGIASVIALSMLVLPLAVQPILGERDLRVRTHLGAMGRFHLDALIGLLPLRSHGAERPLRREHDNLVLEWVRNSREYLRWVVAVDGLQAAVGYGLSAWLFVDYLGRSGEAAAPVLLLYWSMSLPMLGQELGLIARQLPVQRNIALRLLELLGAPSASSTELSRPMPTGSSLVAPHAPITPNAIAIEMREVAVRAAGHTILEQIDLEIPAGSHVAIVGRSGSGKSSLVGLLLGFHQPASGRVFVDGRVLDEARLNELRAQLAWVDPSVRIWNRSLFDNLEYGAPPDAANLAGVLHASDTHPILEKLPDGLQTALGEAGGLLSGGEAQRVRFGRALRRSDARLVILDEPFRGLDHDARRTLLGRARTVWKDATLLCITHDLHETRGFERVLVLDEGRIVEDASPALLEARTDSHYRALLDAETELRDGFWSDQTWRRLQLRQGNLVEG